MDEIHCRMCSATVYEISRLKSIPVVIVTTSHNPRDVEWCYQHGANGYQVKAIGYDQFRSAMRLLVEYWLTVCVLPATADSERLHTG